MSCYLEHWKLKMTHEGKIKGKLIFTTQKSRPDSMTTMLVDTKFCILHFLGVSLEDQESNCVHPLNL